MAHRNQWGLHNKTQLIKGEMNAEFGTLRSEEQQRGGKPDNINQ